MKIFPEVRSYADQRSITGTTNNYAYSQPLHPWNHVMNNQQINSTNNLYQPTSVFPEVGSFAYRYSPDCNMQTSYSPSLLNNNYHIMKQTSVSEKSTNIKNPYKKQKISSVPYFNKSQASIEQKSVYSPHPNILPNQNSLSKMSSKPDTNYQKQKK